MDFPTIESLAKRYVEEDIATMEFNNTPATRKVAYNGESKVGGSRIGLYFCEMLSQELVGLCEYFFPPSMRCSSSAEKAVFFSQDSLFFFS